MKVIAGVLQRLRQASRAESLAAMAPEETLASTCSTESYERPDVRPPTARKPMPKAQSTRIAAKARWAGIPFEERSRIMREVRLKREPKTVTCNVCKDEFDFRREASRLASLRQRATASRKRIDQATRHAHLDAAAFTQDDNLLPEQIEQLTALLARKQRPIDSPK
jgi:hypothetical protein